MSTPPPPLPLLGTVVPSVRFQVIDKMSMKWVTVATGPETPLMIAAARALAPMGAVLWVRDEAGRRPLPGR